MMRNRLRWLPAIAVPALIAAGVVAANASGDIELPERSPAEVLALVAEHPDTSFSGTVEQESALGLPELPADGPSAVPEAAEALEWLSGSHSVRVFADGPTKARLQAPEAAIFEFTPPPGTDVTEHPVPEKPDADEPQLDPPVPSEVPQHSDKPELSKPSGPEQADPIISGSGWTTVVELPAASAPAEQFASPLFSQLTTAVDGGRLLSTALINVLITDDGRVLVGAVPVHLLQAAVTSQ